MHISSIDFGFFVVSTAKKFYLSRQRQTLPVTPESKDKPVVLNSNKSLKEYSDVNTNSLTVVFKDLGA